MAELIIVVKHEHCKVLCVTFVDLIFNAEKPSAIAVTCSFSISHDQLFGPVIKLALLPGKFKSTSKPTWIC